jgi:hypothetical protein
MQSVSKELYNSIPNVTVWRVLLKGVQSIHVHLEHFLNVHQTVTGTL